MNDKSSFLTHGGSVARTHPPANSFAIALPAAYASAMANPVTVQIDIFSDVICPWCFIGKKRLEMAAEMHGGVKLAINWRAFLLNPGNATRRHGPQSLYRSKIRCRSNEFL